MAPAASPAEPTLTAGALRVLYLHGFASGPGSVKGLSFERFFSTHGIAIERLDLRRPSLQHLRLSAILATIAAMNASLGAATRRKRDAAK
ncbi:MAG: hypothetical protein HC863_01450, partial [Myxococcales bacterium]|nr:hypothetical protein [Myxococcales bacterium]